MTSSTNLPRTPSPVLNPDVLCHILAQCTPSTLTTCARVSRAVHDMSIPKLYRHLSLDLAMSNPLISTPALPIYHPLVTRVGGPATQAPALPANPHLHHIRTLHISAHHRANCASLSATAKATPPSLLLPNLRSLHFQIDRLTYHWPHGCPLVQSLTPSPPELVLSADKGCDVLYWAFGVRYYETIPDGVHRLVFLMNSTPDLPPMPRTQMREGVDVGKRKVISSLQRIKHGHYLSCPSREVVLVYGDEWRTGAASRLEALELEAGNIAVLALLVAEKVTVHGLAGRGQGEGEREDVMRVIEEKVSEVAAEQEGLDQEKAITEAMARINLSERPWAGGAL